MPIQIFASDLDEGALVTAREGRYPRGPSKPMSARNGSPRFFVDEGTHFRVRKQVRDTVLFASHSVLKDPPFMRLDLISCRNLNDLPGAAACRSSFSGCSTTGCGRGACLFSARRRPADSAPTSLRRSTGTPGSTRRARGPGAGCRRCRMAPHRSRRPIRAGARPGRRTARRGRRRSMRARWNGWRRSACWWMMRSGSCTCRRGAGRYIQHSGGTSSARLPAVVSGGAARRSPKGGAGPGAGRQLASMTPSRAHPVRTDGLRRSRAPCLSGPGQGTGRARGLLVLFPRRRSRSGGCAHRTPGIARWHPTRCGGSMGNLKEALVASRAEHELAMEDFRAANARN